MAHKITQSTDVGGRKIYLVGDTGQYAYTKAKAQEMAKGHATKTPGGRRRQSVHAEILEAQEFGYLPTRVPENAEVRIYAMKRERGGDPILEGYRQSPAGVTTELVTGETVPGFLRTPSYWSGTGAEYNKIAK